MKINPKFVLLMAALMAVPSMVMARPRISASTRALLQSLPESTKAQLRAMNAKRVKEVKEIKTSALSKASSMDAAAKAELRATTKLKIKALNQKYIQEARTLVNKK